MNLGHFLTPLQLEIIFLMILVCRIMCLITRYFTYDCDSVVDIGAIGMLLSFLDSIIFTFIFFFAILC